MAIGRDIRREDFLPVDQQRFAGQDRPLPIGHGQTNSQPTTVRNMLELLDVQPGDRVLDVGSGSGWTTALLGDSVGSSGTVLGVELVPELVAMAQQNLAPYSMPWVSVRLADPKLVGLPDEAPFDRILVSAGARSLPQELVRQLRVGATMVIPVDGVMTRVRRTEGGTQVEHHGAYSFVPLIEST